MANHSNGSGVTIEVDPETGARSIPVRVGILVQPDGTWWMYEDGDDIEGMPVIYYLNADLKVPPVDGLEVQATVTNN